MTGLFGSSTANETTNESAMKLFATPDKADAAYDAAACAAANDSNDSAVVTVKAKGAPKMDALYGGSSDTMIGYFGGMDFIDKREEFNSTFETDPVILPTVPTVPDNTATAKLLLDLSYQCRLNVYLHACRKFDAGMTGVDESTSMI